jgi:transcriptional regulator with XRE-family HTH domain
MTLSDWKRGKSKPKADKMKKIADVLNVSVDYLINGTEIILEVDSDFLAELSRNKRLLEELYFDKFQLRAYMFFLNVHNQNLFCNILEYAS